MGTIMTVSYELVRESVDPLPCDIMYGPQGGHGILCACHGTGVKICCRCGAPAHLELRHKQETRGYHEIWFDAWCRDCYFWKGDWPN